MWIELSIDRDGRFVYVTTGFTAGAGSPGGIAAYAIDTTSGALKPVADSPFSVPRDANYIAFDPTDTFAYVVANSTVSVYTINQTTGSLKPVRGSPFTAGNNSEAIIMTQPH